MVVFSVFFILRFQSMYVLSGENKDEKDEIFYKSNFIFLDLLL